MNTATNLTIEALRAQAAELAKIAAENAAMIAAAEKAAEKASKKEQAENAEKIAMQIAQMMRDNGVTLALVGEAFHKINEKPRAAHLSELDIVKVTHLLEAGFPQSTIAEKIGCTVGQIVHLRETKNIKRGEPIVIGAWFSGKKGPIPEAVQKELDEMISAELAQFVQ